MLLHWIAHFLGLDDLSGPFYGFWSGVGSDLGEVTLIGGMVVLYRQHTCHVDGCWRFGRHHVEGTAFQACRRHHPSVPGSITAEHIAAAHEAASKKGTE